jgi:PAS domain S-box-containing protein
MSTRVVCLCFYEKTIKTKKRSLPIRLTNSKVVSMRDEVLLVLIFIFSACSFLALLIFFFIQRRQITRLVSVSSQKDLSGSAKESFLIEEQFINALSSISEGIIVINCDNIVRYLNKTAEKLLGTSDTDLIGQRIDVSFLYTGNSKEYRPFQSIIEGIEQCTEEFTGYRCRIAPPGQESEEFNVTIVPLRDLNNHLSGISLVLHEILSNDRIDNDPAQILQQHLKSLAQIEQVFGEKHNTTATFYNNTAYLYFLQKKYEKAISLYKKAIAIREELFGVDHISVASSFDDLARVYHSKGDYKMALQFLQRSIRIKKDHLGNDHSDTAYTYHIIGRVYQSEQKFDQALRYYNEALKIRKNALGDEHLDTASSYNNIGGLYIAQNKYAEAEKYFIKALHIRWKLLGDKHVKIGQVCLSLGIIYYQTKKPQQAEKYLLEAEDIFSTFNGPQHPLTKDVYHWIAHLFQSTGRLKEANLYRERTEFFKGNLL